MKKALIAICIICTMVSCGSKKKTVERTKFTTEIAKVERVSELTESKSNVAILQVGVKERYLITDDSDVILTQADSDKEIILTDSYGRTTKIKGANASISSRKKTETARDSIAQKEINKTIELSDKLIESKELENTKIKTTNKDLDVKRGFPWWLLIVLGALYGLISLWRKSMNPIKWLT